MAKKQSAKKYTFYRFRFWIGYGMLILAVIGLLSVAVAYVPGGLSELEQTSALKSASLNLAIPNSLLVSDLPYHALQKLSLSLLGLSSLSVKLTSAVIAFITSIGLVLLLRRWFPARVSVITGGVAVTSAPFIFLAQQGTPAIMTLFWPVVILLLASISIRKGRLQYFTIPLLGVAAALSLYTPLSVFTLIALLIAGLLHPHVRYVVRRKIPKPLLFLSVLLGIVALLPLCYLIYIDPVLLSALAISSGNLSLNLLENVRLLVLQFGDFSGQSTAATQVIAPFFTASVSLLILAGVYRLVRFSKYTAQNYILMSWLFLLAPIALLNPQRPEILFIPLIILSGVGVSYIMQYWYRLFPKNPYARAFGLLPLTVLIGGIMLTDSLRYFYSYHYSAPLTANITQDLSLVEHELGNLPQHSTSLLVVADDERPIYTLLKDTNKLSVRILTSKEANDESMHLNNMTIIATRKSSLAQSDVSPERIVASQDATRPSDRLYIYKNIAK